MEKSLDIWGVATVSDRLVSHIFSFKRTPFSLIHLNAPPTQPIYRYNVLCTLFHAHKCSMSLSEVVI